MIRLLIFLFTSALCTICIGQGDVSWTKDSKLEGFKRIIGEKDGYVYLELSLYGDFERRDYDSSILKLDPNGNIEAEIYIDNLEKSDWQQLKIVNTKEGIAVIYLTTDPDDKSYFIIAAQLYDYKDLSPLHILDLKKIKYRHQSEARVGTYIIDENIDIDFIATEDKSKLGIFYTEERLGKDKYTMIDYGVYDLDDGFRNLNEGILETDEAFNKYKVSDLVVNINGDVAIINKEYTDTRNYEHYKDKPGYRYSIYYRPTDGEGYVYDIKNPKLYIDEMLALMDSTGVIYIAGMTRKNPNNNVFGTRLVSVDEKGNLIYDEIRNFTEKEIEQIRGKKKKSIGKDFNVVDIKLSDGILYPVFMYYSEEERHVNDRIGMVNRNSFAVETWAETKWMTIQGVNAESGEVRWTNRLMTSIKDFSMVNSWSDPSIHVLKGGLVVIYNDNPKNIVRYKAYKNPNKVDLPNSKTCITLAHLTSDGKVSYKTISEKSKFGIADECSWKSGNEIYILKSRLNFNRYSLGKITF